MKVLWLINFPLTQVAAAISRKTGNGGGWLVSTADDLVKKKYDFTVCFPLQNCTHMLSDVTPFGIKYIAFPRRKRLSHQYDAGAERYLKEILEQVKPDVFHIWGTEYPHTLAGVKAGQEFGLLQQMVVSIQGLCWVCAKHYSAGLSEKIIKQFDLTDILFDGRIARSIKLFEKRGEYEKKALSIAKHVIGRTDWDKACVTQLNPDIQYHFCNETLRETFYQRKWNIESIERHSIFMSQATNPIKGLHFMLEALPLILKRFPDTKLYVAGTDYVNEKSLKSTITNSQYIKYIQKKIEELNLRDRIVFTGQLSEHEMCKKYLEANVFVSPSSIENSPNSIGEAMLLGVPTVSSDVGGVKNLMKHAEEGFIYPYDEPYMLAYYVCEIFEKDTLALSLSEYAINHAKKIYDREKNLRDLENIYDELTKKGYNEQ